MGSLSTEGPTNSCKHSKVACTVRLKQWYLSYPAVLRALSIPFLAAQRRQLTLCTFFSYVNRLSIAHSAKQ